MSYIDEVLERVKTKNASEPEFLQAAEERTIQIQMLRVVMLLRKMMTIQRRKFRRI